LGSAGAAGGAGAAAGLAIATLVLPQVTSIAAPTPLLSALVTLLLALLGAGVQRWTSWNTRESAFGTAIRVTPQFVENMVPADLGVYPAKELGAYRARAEDAAIRDELGPTDARPVVPVLIVGAAGCGKSRTAYQAALEVLPTTPVFVPQDAAGLRWLIDNEPAKAIDRNLVILWLDGLDRLIDGLDPASVGGLVRAGKPAVQIIATIRADRWDDLRDGTGQSSEVARALDDVAGTWTLEEAWGELSTTVADQSVFRAVPTEPASQRKALGSRPIWGDRWFRCVGAVAAVVIGLGLFIGVSSHGRSLVEPPPVADQIASVTQGLLGVGRHLVVSERVQLHATEDPSWVVVTEDAPSSSAFYGGAVGDSGFRAPESDDLRIYDVRKGWLRLMLEFRPSGSGKAAWAWSTPSGAPAALDYNDDGTEEIIAGWEAPDAHGDTVPFVIDWQRSRYTLIAMTPRPPELGTVGFGDPNLLKDRQHLYLHKFTLRNAARGWHARTLAGFGVQAYALSQKPIVRLLTGYYSELPGAGPGGDSVLQVRANQIEHSTLTLSPCVPQDQACPAPPSEQDAFISPAKTLNNGLLAAWDERGTRWNAPVSLKAQPRRECLATTLPPSEWAQASGCGAASTLK
jgi:hypothetical protein